MKIKRDYVRFIFLILSVLCIVFIFGNSMQSAELSNRASNIFADRYRDILKLLGIENVSGATHTVRKAAHVFEFFLLSVFLGTFFALGIQKFYKRVIYVLFSGLFTACCDEFIQLFSEGRAGMIQDVFIDFTGVLAGAAAVAAVWYFGRERRCAPEAGGRL